MPSEFADTTSQTQYVSKETTKASVITDFLI